MSACTSHDMPRCRHSLATKNGKCLVTALPRSVLYASRKVWMACPRRASQGFEPGVTRIVQKKLGSIPGPKRFCWSISSGLRILPRSWGNETCSSFQGSQVSTPGAPRTLHVQDANSRMGQHHVKRGTQSIALKIPPEFTHYGRDRLSLESSLRRGRIPRRIRSGVPRRVVLKP